MSWEIVQIGPKDLEPVIVNIAEACQPKLYAKFNAAFLAQCWANFLTAGTGHAYGAVPNAGRLYHKDVAGILLGLTVPDMMTGEFQGLEYLWAVKPEHRKSGAGKQLLDAFEETCRGLNCKRVVTGASAWLNDRPMDRLYRKMGYVNHAAVFSKEL